MDTLSGDISSMVFRRAINNEPGDIRLNGEMLSILSELDGIKNLGLIARTLGIDASAMRTAVSRLMELQIIQAIEGSMPLLGTEFFDFLRDQLSLIAGPIAQIMMEDAFGEIGPVAAGIPKNRAAELIELLARQIPGEAQRAAFIQVTMEKIK